MAKVIVDFFMNNPLEVLLIGSLAYFLVGRFMRFLWDDLGINLGRQGGRLVWLVVAIVLSACYHFIIDLF